MRFVAILAMIFACIAQPAAAASSAALRSLEQQLQTLVEARSGEYGIAALDLRTGESVSVNGHEPFPMASTVKVAVAAAYLAQVDHGRRSLDDRIGGRSAYRLMDAMLVRSDNHATDLLIRNLGGAATVQQWVAWHGLTGMRVDRTIAQLLRARRDLRDVRDSSTPLAMVELLRKIDSGKVLKPESRALLLSMMARCRTGKNRIRGLLPPGVHVENKTGTLSGLSDDVGYITMPDGRRIAIAVFARYGGNRSRTIAEAARTIYHGFASARWSPYVAATSTSIRFDQAVPAASVPAQPIIIAPAYAPR